MQTAFENALNRFQFSLMERWYNLYRQEIGLLIQKFDYVQDASVPTRIGHDVSPTGPVHSATKFINSHCARIQRDNLDKCNKLDVLLKKQASANPGFSRASITCRCHAGVSNVLIPYRHPKENDTNKVWYIFIGQFLLREEASAGHTQFMQQLLKSRLFHPLLVKHIMEEDAPFVKPDIFIAESTYNNTFDGATREGHISYISAIDLLLFQESALASFETFLNRFYETPEGVAQVAEYFSTTRPGQRLHHRAEDFKRWFFSLPQPPSFRAPLEAYVKSVLLFANSGKADDVSADRLISWFNEGQQQSKIQDRAWFAGRPSLDSLNAPSTGVENVKRRGGFIKRIFSSGA